MAPIRQTWPSLLLQLTIMGGAVMGIAWQGGGEAEGLRAELRTLSVAVEKVERALDTVGAIDKRVAHIESTRDTPRVDDLSIRVRALEREVDVLKARSAKEKVTP